MAATIDPASYLLIGAAGATTPAVPPAMTFADFLMLGGGAGARRPTALSTLTLSDFLLLAGNPPPPPPPTPPSTIAYGDFLVLSRQPPGPTIPATLTYGDYLLLVGNPPRPPATFLAAVRRALLADAGLAGLVPGGWWHRKAATRTPLPYGVYQVTRDDRHSSGGPNYIHTGTFSFDVYATSDRAARVAADRAVLALTDRIITFQDGRLYYMRLDSPVSTRPPLATYDAADCFVAMRDMTFTYQGAYQS